MMTPTRGKAGEGKDSLCSWWCLIDAGREKCHESFLRRCGQCLALKCLLNQWKNVFQSGVEWIWVLEWDKCSSVSWTWAYTQLPLAQRWFSCLLNRDEHSDHLPELLYSQWDNIIFTAMSPVTGLGLACCRSASNAVLLLHKHTF